MRRELGLRWTIGDVSERGFEALRLSLFGARRIFGPAASYVVCVNTIPVALARAKTGAVPPEVVWRDTTGELPGFLRRRLDTGMAEGVAWKLAPVRLFPDRYELSLDNDCVLWEIPDEVRRWLYGEPGALVAEDVRACFGRFADLCGEAPRNLGMRGLPPGFDFEAALARLLEERPGPLASELDEQGLQLAALSRLGRLYVVGVSEVTICSPFPPHLPYLGRAGAHFVGLNARRLGWSLEGRPAEEHTLESWLRLRGEVYARVGLRSALWEGGPPA
jgi:hypothetical protein